MQQNCKVCSALHDRLTCPYCGGSEEGLGATVQDSYEAVIIGGPGFFVKVVVGLIKHAFNAGIVAGHEGRPMTGPVWEEYVNDPKFGGIELTGHVEMPEATTGPKTPDLVPIEDVFEAFQKFHSGLAQMNSAGLWRKPKKWNEAMAGLQKDLKDSLPTLAGLIDWDDRSGDRPVQSTGPADDRSNE